MGSPKCLNNQFQIGNQYAARPSAQIPDERKAHPTGAIPAVDIVKPSPGATLHATPLSSDRQVNGPIPVVWR